MNGRARVLGFVVSAVAAVSSAACGGGDGGSSASAIDVPAASDAGPLSPHENQFLAYTREEEKLARDTYRAIGAGRDPFENIAASEQTHMDAIGTLLSRYSVADPAQGSAAGAFKDAGLAALYTALVAEGTRSSLDALRVGAEVEELDIFDLEEGMVGVTHSDIVTTMENLRRGSRNHLRAFYAKLRAQGGTYAPKHLSQSAFDAIVNSEKESGAN